MPFALANFLLVATGAGWSADAGLPTYTQIPVAAQDNNQVYQHQGVDYADLCRAKAERSGPSYFMVFGPLGFMPTKTPRRTRDMPFSSVGATKKRRNNRTLVPLSLRIITTRVMSMEVLRRVGFSTNCIHEMHGAADAWLVVVS